MLADKKKPCMLALWILVILAVWACISFHFKLLDLHFLYFGLLGCHFLSGFGPRGLRWGSASSDQGAVNAGRQKKKPCMLAFWILVALAFWAFTFFHFGFWTFISFIFGLLGCNFLSGFGPWVLRLGSACCDCWPLEKQTVHVSVLNSVALAFWAFTFFHFGLLGLHFLSFWHFGPSFPFIFCLSGLPRGVPSTSCQKRSPACTFATLVGRESICIVV